MLTKAVQIVLAGVSAMLLLASPWAASGDELGTTDDNLALSAQPAGDETLAKQSGAAAPVNTVDTNSNIVQQQPNTIIIPTAMTMTIAKSGSIGIGNTSSSASITSSTSAAVVRNGAQ